MIQFRTLLSFYLIFTALAHFETNEFTETEDCLTHIDTKSNNQEEKREMNSLISTSRLVKMVLPSRPQKEGAGVTIRRTIGTNKLDYYDPFLLLDEFNTDNPDEYLAGFPNHPHRGFETVSYMLDGKMLHEDHKGNKGLLGPGAVQWMTAGRGIIHSEMPQMENGKMRGFQMWVNLPAASKMVPPRYQDYQAESIPVVKKEGKTIKIMAGEYDNVKGAVNGIATNPLYMDITLEPNETFSHQIEKGHTTFAYCFEGSGFFGPSESSKSVQESTLVTFETQGDQIDVKAGPKGARFLLAAARPINEPMARYGPFVMNTQEEIQQAFSDFRSGKF